jgi:hypothetical protein
MNRKNSREMPAEIIIKAQTIPECYEVINSIEDQCKYLAKQVQVLRLELEVERYLSKKKQGITLREKKLLNKHLLLFIYSLYKENDELLSSALVQRLKKEHFTEFNYITVQNWIDQWRRGKKPEEMNDDIQTNPPVRIAIKADIRFAVLARDNFRCRYCGREASEVKLHVDHLFPISKGGGDSLGNYITSCQDCNLGKHAKLLLVSTAKRKMPSGKQGQIPSFILF